MLLQLTVDLEELEHSLINMKAYIQIVYDCRRISQCDRVARGE